MSSETAMKMLIQNNVKVPRLDLIWQGGGGAGNGPVAGKRNAINAMIALLLRQIQRFQKDFRAMSQDKYDFGDLQKKSGKCPRTNIISEAQKRFWGNVPGQI